MLVSARQSGAGRPVPAQHWRTREAITWRISVTPGTIRVSTRKVGGPDTDREATAVEHRAQLWADHDAQLDQLDMRTPWTCTGCEKCDGGHYCETCPECTRARMSALAIACTPADSGPSRSKVTEWSRKSRARMVEALAALDYRPLFVPGRSAAMVTLTLPGDWVTIAPTGRAFKAIVKRFKTRYQRAWGEKLSGIWKLEFQGRGAPHLHILMAPPRGLSKGHGRRDAEGRRAFEGLRWHDWSRLTWADVCAHPDPEERAKHERAGTRTDYAEGQRATDPKRVAVYFVKHATPGGAASKEYQHIVPAEWQGEGDGPGRFWGVWDLERVERTVEVSPDEAITAARILRRHSRAQQSTRAVMVYRPKVDKQTGEVRDHYRRSRVRAVRMQSGRGFVCHNNAPSMLAHVARYLDLRRQWASTDVTPPGSPSRVSDDGQASRPRPCAPSSVQP